jgi:hypothetical protein
VTAPLLLALVLSATPAQNTPPVIPPTGPSEGDAAKPSPTVPTSTDGPAATATTTSDSAKASSPLSGAAAAHLWLMGQGYSSTGSRWGDIFFVPQLNLRGSIHGFTGELGFVVATPLSANVRTGGVLTSYTLIPRVGYTGQTWAARLGATIQLLPGSPAPSLILPSLHLEKHFGDVGIALGLFDDTGYAPLHLTFSTRNFFIGYVAPIGATAGIQFEPRDDLWLTIRGLAFRFFNTDTAMVSVGLSWGGTRL